MEINLSEKKLEIIRKLLPMFPENKTIAQITGIEEVIINEIRKRGASAFNEEI